MAAGQAVPQEAEVCPASTFSCCHCDFIVPRPGSSPHHLNPNVRDFRPVPPGVFGCQANGLDQPGGHRGSRPVCK